MRIISSLIMCVLFPVASASAKVIPEIEMVVVEGGTFTMGFDANETEHAYETPKHQVTLSTYRIGKYEVTQELWEAVMGENPSISKGENLPVENVSWHDIQTFIQKLNKLTGKKYRLPTEAEWEYFSEKYSVRNDRTFFGIGSRAASIAAIVCTSIVAVAAGIAVTVTVIDHKSHPNTDTVTLAPKVAAVSTDTLTAKSDTVKISLTPIMFENEPLEKIMKEIADAYCVEEVRFNNPEVATLHLYYRFDPSLPLNAVLEQLNTFEQINIKYNCNILIVD